MAIPSRRRIPALLLAAACLAWAPSFHVAVIAQITVGANGPDTTDSTSYSGAQGLTKTGSNKVTLTGTSFYSGATTISGGSGRITLSNPISNDFLLKGDVTFGSNDSSRTIRSSASSATARIVNNGAFWWIGSETVANALSLDIASGVSAFLNGSVAAGNLYYNNLSGSGNFAYNNNATGYILGASTLTGTLTAGNRDISFGNGGATGSMSAELGVGISADAVVSDSATDHDSDAQLMVSIRGAITEMKPPAPMPRQYLQTGTPEPRRARFIPARAGFVTLLGSSLAPVDGRTVQISPSYFFIEG